MQNLSLQHLPKTEHKYLGKTEGVKLPDQVLADQELKPSPNVSDLQRDNEMVLEHYLYKTYEPMARNQKTQFDWPNNIKLLLNTQGP